MSYDVSTFQGLIFAVQDYWQKQGCAVLQPLDLEVGAGTFHPATFLRAVGPDFAIVRAMVFLGSVLYIIGLILTDIAYTVVDPRVRLS